MVIVADPLLLCAVNNPPLLTDSTVGSSECQFVHVAVTSRVWPSVKMPRRSVTTTPLQALGLMNNSFVQRHSAHLAERASRASGNDLSRAVHAAYRLALGRAPTSDEAGRALAAARERGLANVCWALFNSTEFVYVR